MPYTEINTEQVANSTIKREDLDVTTVGSSVITKIINGSGISISQTGADNGTGDVTISLNSSSLGGISWYRNFLLMGA